MTPAELDARLAVARRFTPVDDRVVLLPDQIGEQTQGGVIIPEVAREKPQEALVAAVGPNAQQCRVADRVLYGKYSGTEITVDGVDYLIMHDKDVLLVLGERP